MPETTVTGMLEAQRKMEQTIADLRGDAFLQGMRDATLMVSRRAKELAPVDTGRLRASITPEIRQEGTNILGVIGSKVKYAASAEFGSKAHTPPISQIRAWAKRKGIESEAGAIWRAIREAGTQGHFFFQNAFEESKDAIIRKIGDVVGRIVQK